MRLFRERAGVSPSYIHDIEQGTTVPSPEKLRAITAVLRDVAIEQGAADPDAEGRELLRAREQTMYVERLHIDPRLARIFIALGELDEGSLATIEEPILAAIGFFSTLEQPFQRGMSQALLEAMAVVERLEGDERAAAGMEIADAVSSVITQVKEQVEQGRGTAVLRLDASTAASMPSAPRRKQEPQHASR